MRWYSKQYKAAGVLAALGCISLALLGCAPEGQELPGPPAHEPPPPQDPPPVEQPEQPVLPPPPAD